MDKWGIHGSLLFGVVFGVLPIVLIPLASLFTGRKVGAIFYLAIVMGGTKVSQSSFFSSITIATNRTVPNELRSSMVSIN